MPEFPEVYTIVTDLNRELKNKVLTSVTVLDKALARPSPEAFNNIVGKKVKGVFQIAKHIVINFDDDVFVVFHLRMTGRLLLRKKGELPDYHLRIFLEFKDLELRFVEVRKFGYAEIYSKERLELLRARIAPTPFQTNEQSFLKQIKSKKTIIKRVLLDQKVISGIGNIYANDSLWMAKINPLTPIPEISDKKLLDLFISLKEVLQEGISHRGSTLEDESYVDIYGKKGSHQNFFRVYNRVGKTCLLCKSIIQMVQISKRSSFYCPKCQRREVTNDQLSMINVQ